MKSGVYIQKNFQNFVKMNAKFKTTVQKLFISTSSLGHFVFGKFE